MDADVQAKGRFFLGLQRALNADSFVTRVASPLRKSLSGLRNAGVVVYTARNARVQSLAFNGTSWETNALFGTTTIKTGHRIMQFVAKFYF